MDTQTLRNIKILSSEKQTYHPTEAKILSKKQLTKNTYLFKIKNILGKILPGQFIEVSVMGIGEAPISVCNYDKDSIELLIRNVGNVTNHLSKLKEKEKMLIRGPYGHGYPIYEFKDYSTVIIAGGTGIAPPRSVIEYFDKNNNSQNLTIMLGFRNYENILFKEDIKNWKKKYKTYLTIDNENKNWDGDVGAITNLLDKYKIPKKAKFVLCGPPIMIKFVSEKLIEKNYSETDIYISYERKMKCGIGKCGHCMIHGKYVCNDGPVFRYDISKKFSE